jgi:hypothetical protein
MFPQFDPSKMDPKVLMQLSQLIQQLPPDQLNKMQGLMHNAMAGFDVRSQMEEFERGLPPGFREKLMALIGSNPGAFMPGMSAMGGMPGVVPVEPTVTHEASVEPEGSDSANMDMREARLTVLRGVAAGQVSPEQAEKLLFG